VPTFPTITPQLKEGQRVDKLGQVRTRTRGKGARAKSQKLAEKNFFLQKSSKKISVFD
tara:strand:+ start:186 stop:359 length:174 start_codon:yes stop_codon:yes gene_type:complete